MSWLRTLFAPPRADYGPAPWDDFWYEPAELESETGIAIGPESSMRTSAVFSCVRVLSNAVSSIPLLLYRRTADGGRERATEHPLYEVLHSRPNAWQTSLEFREMLQAHLCLRGNAYALIKTSGGGQVTALEPIHPDLMKVLIDTQGRLVYEYKQRDNTTVRKLADEIFHLRWLSLDGYVGLTPISYAKETLGRQLAMERSNSRFFQNDATPRVVLKHPLKFSSKEAAERIIASWNQSYGGYQRAHKAAILEEGMDVTTLGLKPEDAQFVESWEIGVADICRWFGVNPRKIGAKSGDSQTYSNVEQAQIEHVTDTVLPHCARWEQTISRSLLLPREQETYYPEFLIEGLLRADSVARATLYEKAVDRWMTVNEIRARENMPPVEGGDEIKEPEPPPAAAPPEPEPEPEPEEKPAAVAPTFTIAPQIDVKVVVEPGRAPEVSVHVDPPPAPEVHFAPQIHVEQPEVHVEAAPAPVVHVDVAPPIVQVNTPDPPPRVIKRRPDGSFEVTNG